MPHYGQKALSPVARDNREGAVSTRWLMHRMLKLTNRLMAPFSAHLATQHKIGVNEFRMLTALGRWGQQASHELAERTGVSAMSVSRAVGALQKNGRIKVETDPNNRRRKRLRLTEKGRALYEEAEPQSDRVAAYLFRELSDEELKVLDGIVDKLLHALEETDEQGRSLFIEETRPDKSE